MQTRVKTAVSFSRNFFKTLHLVWQVSPPFTFLTLFTLLLGSLIPAGQTFLGKLIVDEVVDLIGVSLTETALRRVFILILLALLLALLNELLQKTQDIGRDLLTELVLNRINTLVLQQSARLDFSFFENAKFYDQIEKVRRESNHRPIRLLFDSFDLIEHGITAASMFLLLSRFGPLIWVILVLVGLPELFFSIAYSYRKYFITDSRTPESRKIWYWSHLLSSERTIKEIKLFNLTEHFLGRYTRLFKKFYGENKNLSVRRSVVDFTLGFISSVVFYATYAFVILRTITGIFTLGDLTLFHNAFRSALERTSRVISGLARLYEHNLYLTYLFDFLAWEPRILDVRKPKRMPSLLQQGIEFRGVSFRYPDAKHNVLEDINLRFFPNESVSLVGLNGAGKTTLVKLLTRLYEPTQGQILIDGVDYREFKISEMRRAMGVIFQDFVAYQDKARDNIGYGDLDKLSKLPEIIRAAKTSGAHQVIKGLPEEYETLLGKQFEGGHELSWGEWQKIALARGFFRDAQILILDEPTASLDAEAEYLLYRKFARLAEDRIVILISHRFSTVRVAKKICVLDKGRVVEEGTHEQLMGRNGEYAQLFTMQAEGYR